MLIGQAGLKECFSAVLPRHRAAFKNTRKGFVRLSPEEIIRSRNKDKLQFASKQVVL